MKKYTTTYDAIMDVLYINKNTPRNANSVILDNSMHLRKKGNEIIGITIESFNEILKDGWKITEINKHFIDYNLLELSKIKRI